MSPHRLHSISPLATMFQRLGDTDLATWLIGLFVAVVSWIAADPFWPIYWICFGMTWADYFWGVRMAKARDQQAPGAYDPLRATLGWHSKLMGLTLLLVAWSLGQWAIHFYETRIVHVGAIAIGFAFVRREAESINEKSIAAGAGPVPVISEFLKVLEAVEGVLFKRSTTSQGGAS